MRTILNKLDAALDDPEFVAVHRYRPQDFSRQRSLTFRHMALFFLSGAVPSLQFGMDKLFRGLTKDTLDWQGEKRREPQTVAL
ncbi:hypothetical protein [Ectothiorhodospira haloalkaliphila]|uniref:hypothetical protein n=1 Tax=Ectothiorhodospira haloalkaliphila TaxID=421628 RepID=UPI00047D8D57|nr:hypothetical protein [Ectothiorhodospira haloalkaliphila]